MLYKNYKGETIEIAHDDTRDALLSDFGKATLKDRYLLPGETPQTLFARVAGAYSDDTAMGQRIYDYISRHWFMPATPVLSNGGTTRGFPISCFLNNVDDSLDGIAKVWNENVWLAARGGGIGTRWSDVRSLDEKIGEVGHSSGVIPFIKVQDSMTLGISQGSLRRGSAAVYLDVSHPEIEEFIDLRRIKGDPNRRSLNLHHGVTIPDTFMEAVEANASWDLVSPRTGDVIKTVSARELWQKILITRLEEGEPYIVWTDTVNRQAPEVYKHLGLKVTQSNLCSEIALHTGTDHLGFDRTAVCCLSSLNLATVDEWYGDKQFLKDVAVFLDNVLQDFINRTNGVSGFEGARYSAMRERSIGIGVMGFHTYLQRKRIPYESALAHSFNRRVFNWLDLAGKEINQDVAKERGPCPDAIDAGLNVRWSHLFAIAPTASISIIAAAGGTTSPGVEPHAANVFIQKTLSGSFEVKNMELDRVIREHSQNIEPESVEEFVEQAWGQVKIDEGSVKNLVFLSDHEKEAFRTFIEIDQRWVITHASTRAPFIDQMASNNLSLPGSVHKRDLHLLHMKAWKEGVPSLYYLRSKAKQRGGKVEHMAGEMPEPSAKHVAALIDLGAAEDLMPSNKNYDECMACQ